MEHESERRAVLDEILERRITINTHSSVRIDTGEKVLYVDPFELREAVHDADLIFFTHDHFDHLSPKDAALASGPETVFVAPASAAAAAREQAAGRRVVTVEPGASAEAAGVRFEAVPAYNPGKPFHPRERGWVGYVLNVLGVRIYVAGDTDATPEAAAVRCDVALLPIGGKYTMDPAQAAGLANEIRPAAVIPTHYGSVVGRPEDFERFAALTDPAIRVCRKI